MVDCFNAQRLLQRFYPESRFGGFSRYDGTVAFYARVHSLLPKAGIVLNVGCGRGRFVEDPVPYRRQLSQLRGDAGKVIGLDVDPAARENPGVDEFRLIKGHSWPVADCEADLIVCDFVLEHVVDPFQFFAEAARALKVNGCLCLRTTNLISYVGIVARLVPNRRHADVVNRVQSEREARDVFPAVYRCNSHGRLRRTLRQSGFDPVVYGVDAEPSYLQFSAFFYALGVLHQKLVPRLFAPCLFAFARKL